LPWSAWPCGDLWNLTRLYLLKCFEALVS
jgi:hypothetical protein